MHNVREVEHNCQNTATQPTPRTGAAMFSLLIFSLCAACEAALGVFTIANGYAIPSLLCFASAALWLLLAVMELMERRNRRQRHEN